MTFSSLLNQSATLYRKSGMNIYGESTYTESTITARVEGTNKRILTVSGEDKPANAMIITASEVSENDKIAVSGDNSRNVMQVDSIPGYNGVIHHYEVYI